MPGGKEANTCRMRRRVLRILSLLDYATLVYRIHLSLRECRGKSSGPVILWRRGGTIIQDLANLRGPFGRTNDALVFHHVHDTRGARVANPHAALQHGDGGTSLTANEVNRFGKQRVGIRVGGTYFFKHCRLLERAV